MGFLFLVIVCLLALLFWVLTVWRADIKKSIKQIMIYHANSPRRNLNLPPIEPLAPKPLEHHPPSDVPAPAVRLKECPRCLRLLAINEFKINKQTQDGLTKWCTSCLLSRKQRTFKGLPYISANKATLKPIILKKQKSLSNAHQNIDPIDNA